MRKCWLMLMAVMCGVLVLGGCAGPEKFDGIKSICVAGADRGQVLAACEDVLGKMHFGLAKNDAEAGYIRSRPLTGAQWFEFWRKDTVGGYNWAQSNMHSVRRVVEMVVDEQDGKVCVECDVSVQRLSLPEREISSISKVGGMFTKSGRSGMRFKFHGQQASEVAWEDVGGDARLETEILRQVEKRIK